MPDQTSRTIFESAMRGLALQNARAVAGNGASARAIVIGEFA